MASGSCSLVFCLATKPLAPFSDYFTPFGRQMIWGITLLLSRLRVTIHHKGTVAILARHEVLLRVLEDKSIARGNPDERSEVIHFQFSHQIGAMLFHRFNANAQRFGNRAVGLAFGDQLQDLAFA